MKLGIWDFSHDRGPTRCHFNGEDFVAAISGRHHKFTQITFTDCDFQGFFESEVQVAFDTCTFINCDFGLTTWSNIKFSTCTFSKCSFGMTNFNNCEFRGSIWSEIGISPNMLQINSTYFSNSSEFIGAAWTSTDRVVLEGNNVTVSRQLMKLEQTKATISRRILRNLQEEGDEDAFYDAVKTFQLQQSYSRRFDAHYRYKNTKRRDEKLLFLLRFFSAVVEKNILMTVGKVNNWGASITKPVFLTVISLLFFALIYHWGVSPSLHPGASLKRSFDITLLAGYSNYGAETDFYTIVVQNLHLITATVLNAITFTTLVARLSKVR